MDSTTISVVMPTFNRATYICEALDSLMRQTDPPAEVVVIDDRSTDDTRERVQGHPFAARIRYHQQPERRGASVARNAGVTMAKGEVIVFLDSDDLLAPNHHQHVFDTFQRFGDLGLYCCDSRMIGPSGESITARTWTATQSHIKGRRIGSGRRTLTDIFLFSTPFPGLAVRRSAYRDVGGLEQSLFPLDDFDLQLKMAGAGLGVYYEHLPLAFYRVHSGNESGSAQAVRVCEQKLRCIELARQRYPEIRALRSRGRQRQGEARRELAIALLREGDIRGGAATLLRSLLEEPRGIGDVTRIAARRLRKLG